jgi:pantetheine-phosphate adenylyltransferase
MPKAKTKPNNQLGARCPKIVVYPGTFDPFTNGHINIVDRALEIFDTVVVTVAHNTSKRTVFTARERVDLIKEVLVDRPNVIVDTFEGLLIDYCKQHGYNVILRGLRTVSDFEFEFQIAHANRQMYHDVETLFMMTESGYSHLSSTIIKEIISFGGNGKGMIPAPVERELKKKFGSFKVDAPRSAKRRKK